MKFTMNGKDFKATIDKLVTVTDKKSIIGLPKGIYFIAKDNKLVAYATDTEQYLELKLDSAIVIEDGICGINIEDLKVVTKLNTEIIVTATVNAIELGFGKKTVTIENYLQDNIIPENITETAVIVTPADWLKETLTKMSVFTETGATQKMFECINVNAKNCRVEALEGHRIGMRSIPYDMILESEVSCSCMIRNIAIKVMKKVLDKRTDNVTVYQGDRYLKIAGDNFTYYQRQFNGQYFDTSKMLYKDYDWKLVTNTKDFAEIMKYNGDLLKESRKPNVLYVDGDTDTVKSYAQCARYKMLDEIECERVEGNVMIAFNPNFMLDALNCSETENVVIYGKKNINPLYVSADDYTFFILPINIKEDIETYQKAVA